MAKKINVNISVDPELKKNASALFKDMGLDFSTAITLFLRQTVLAKKLPFEITTELYNEETQAAFAEFLEMKNNPQKYKRYNSFMEILKEMEDEENTNK